MCSASFILYLLAYNTPLRRIKEGALTMLFLPGDADGKTRWLEVAVKGLVAQGVAVEGVVASGEGAKGKAAGGSAAVEPKL